jgi:hypothetical protein
MAILALGVLVLAGAWYSWRGARTPTRSITITTHPPTATAIPYPTAGSVPISAAPPRVFTIGHIRDGGQWARLGVYRESAAGSLCLSMTGRGDLSCDVLPRRDEVIRLAYADWMYRDSARTRFGMFVVGAIGPSVALVRLSLGAGRWVDATILTLPPRLGTSFRLFYTEKWTGFQSLNHRLPVVALDDHGRAVGRDSYLVLGG